MTAPRVLVVGPSGAGKTTWARRCAALHDLPHVEGDLLRHDPDGRLLPDRAVEERLLQALTGPRWVLDAHDAPPRVWALATEAVWLDPPRPRAVRRLLRRELARARRDPAWPGWRWTAGKVVRTARQVGRLRAVLPARAAAAGVPLLRVSDDVQADAALLLPAEVRRVAVVGGCAVGKSRLARALPLPHVEIDRLRWPGGRTASPEEYAASLAAGTSGERWVLEGSDASEPVRAAWQRADLLVWLDHGALSVAARVLGAGLRALPRGPWRDGGRLAHLRYSAGKVRRNLRRTRQHRRDLPAVLAELEQRGVRTVRLTSVRATRRWTATTSAGVDRART